VLDLEHPLTPHVFRASDLIDGVMVCGQQMSVAPNSVRAELLAECLPLFAEMRELATAQFGKKVQFLLQAIEEYEEGIRRLAALGDGQITEDRRNGEGNCPYCGTTITKFNAYAGSPRLEPHFIILCPKCDDLFMPALQKLRSFEGFGTDAI
jgi:hypothetical protein